PSQPPRPPLLCFSFLFGFDFGLPGSFLRLTLLLPCEFSGFALLQPLLFSCLTLLVALSLFLLSDALALFFLFLAFDFLGFRFRFGFFLFLLVARDRMSVLVGQCLICFVDGQVFPILCEAVKDFFVIQLRIKLSQIGIFVMTIDSVV